MASSTSTDDETLLQNETTIGKKVIDSENTAESESSVSGDKPSSCSPQAIDEAAATGHVSLPIPDEDFSNGHKNKDRSMRFVSDPQDPSFKHIPYLISAKKLERAYVDLGKEEHVHSKQLTNFDGLHVEDWISVENVTGGECKIQESLKNSTAESAEWISVEVPHPAAFGYETQAPHQSIFCDTSCSSPCSLVEWVAVELPPVPASTENEAPTLSVSSLEQDTNYKGNDEAAADTQPATLVESSPLSTTAAPQQTAPVQRTRKRRTISGKIRARIEAFESCFREEIGRLNTPFSKIKNRRMLERHRKYSEETREKAYEHKLSQTKYDELHKLDQDEESESEILWLKQEVDANAWMEALIAASQCEKEAEGVENIPEGNKQGMTNSDKIQDETSIVAEEDEWELAVKIASASQVDKVEEVERTNFRKDLDDDQIAGSIGVGGLMKQVISGAALLAGLLFLWPRGNNLIWRASQKRQRYCMVKRGQANDAHSDSSSLYELFKG